MKIEIKELINTEEVLKELEKLPDYMKVDEQEQKRYEQFKEELHDKASTWEGTYIIGKIEGIKEGEKVKAIEIAKNLLDVLEIETIALKTGLSIEEIKKLNLI